MRIFLYVFISISAQCNKGETCIQEKCLKTFQDVRNFAQKLCQNYKKKLIFGKYFRKNICLKIQSKNLIFQKKTKNIYPVKKGVYFFTPKFFFAPIFFLFYIKHFVSFTPKILFFDTKNFAFFTTKILLFLQYFFTSNFEI